MFNKFRAFWNTFWNAIKSAYNQAFKQPVKSATQDWRDIAAINFLAIFVSKLNNLVNSEATFDVVSDSAQAERLKTLCKELESKRFDITGGMLADGDYYVFPATNEKGDIIHSYLTQDQVRILNADGENITEAYGIIDWYVDSKDKKTYYLLRHHLLDTDGTLTVSYRCVDSLMKPATLERWAYLEDEVYKLVNAGHIGFGRYNSPADSRGLSPIYGVPLNYGCADIEATIKEDLKLINDEFKNGKSVIFTDPRNLIKKSERGEYTIAENIIPIQHRPGDSGPNIDIFSPNLRFSDHYSKIVADMALYEKQVGTSKGILTENETTATATATAVKRANADTIALIDKIRTAVDNGNKMTLEADAVYLNVAADLWNYTSDWYDPFEDPAEQWQRLIEAKSNGAAETSDVVRWIFPRLTADEIEQKIARISSESTETAEGSLERILAGR